VATGAGMRGGTTAGELDATIFQLIKFKAIPSNFENVSQRIFSLFTFYTALGSLNV
jgi:hypothetical protein